MINQKQWTSFNLKYICQFFYQLSIFFVLVVFAINDSFASQQSTARYNIGGQMGHGFMLTDVTYLKISKGERWIISIGDRFGNINQSNPPYFHIEQKSGKLLFIDLAQTNTSRLTSDDIYLKLNKSDLFKSIDMTTDPVDQNMNLRLQLKTDANVKVYQVRGQTQTSKIVIDLTPSRSF